MKQSTHITIGLRAESIAIRRSSTKKRFSLNSFSCHLGGTITAIIIEFSRDLIADSLLDIEKLDGVGNKMFPVIKGIIYLPYINPLCRNYPEIVS